MKNLSKFLLFVALVFAGYFSVVVYGASGDYCPCFGNNCGCSANEFCNIPSGTGQCDCSGTPINHGTYCGIGEDGYNRNDGEVKEGEICKKESGCKCLGENGKEINIKNNVKCEIINIDLSNTSREVNGRNVNISFEITPSNLPITIKTVGDCGEKTFSLSIGVNFFTILNLPNYRYTTCKIYGEYNGNISNTLEIEDFEINVQGGGSSGGGGGGGGSSSATCTDLYLTCINGVYILKSGYYCVGGNLGKSCGVSNVDTGTMELLENIKEKKSTVYEYTPQGIKIRIYVPKFKQGLLRKAVLGLNQNLYRAINKKLLKVTDPSYMIENFEYLEADSKILVYKEIGSIVKLYNDFLGIFYLFVDMGKRDYLPLARTYFEAYLKEFVIFNR